MVVYWYCHVPYYEFTTVMTWATVGVLWMSTQVRILDVFAVIEASSVGFKRWFVNEGFPVFFP